MDIVVTNTRCGEHHGYLLIGMCSFMNRWFGEERPNTRRVFRFGFDSFGLRIKRNARAGVLPGDSVFSSVRQLAIVCFRGYYLIAVAIVFVAVVTERNIMNEFSKAASARHAQMSCDAIIAL